MSTRSCVIALALLGMGFVRQTTPNGTPLEWRSSCPLLSIGPLDPAGPSAAQLRDAIERSIGAWQAEGCDALRFGVSDDTTKRSDVAWDGVNIVVTRAASYCDGGAHDDEEVCLTPSALAVTTMFFIDRPGDPRDGEILETDLELNLRHPFTDDGTASAFDLSSVITHELGHVLGLAHTCTTEPGARIVDPAGHEVPSCREPSTDATSEATMYPWSFAGDLQRRTPEFDERQATCLLYRNHPPTCAGDELVAGYDCNAAAGSMPGVLAVVLLLLVARRRPRAG